MQDYKDVLCPSCGYEFETEVQIDGTCPECELEFTWEEQIPLSSEKKWEDSYALKWEDFETTDNEYEDSWFSDYDDELNEGYDLRIIVQELYTMDQIFLMILLNSKLFEPKFIRSPISKPYASK